MNRSSSWRAGAASAEFSFPDPVPMAGYAARNGHSNGTLDPLTVSCLALEANGEQFVLIAIDLIGVDSTMIEGIAERLGMAESSIAFCASHTHSGPAGVMGRLHPAERMMVNPIHRSRVMRAVEQTANNALAALDDATLTFARSEATVVAANRNVPDGPFDPTVSVISARSANGAPIATVVHFACHPTILPASSRAISADFPGAIRRRLPAEEFGTVLFVNGAAGDVSTRFTRQSQDVAEVERVGEGIATAVRNADTVATLRPRVEARRFTGAMRLRDRSDFERARDTTEQASADLGRDGLSPAERRIIETRLQGAEILERMAERYEALPTQIPISLWSLGELRLYGFPGELFASLGAELTRGREPAVVLGYTNGYFGYFPDRAAYEAGTYESLASPYAAGASEELIAWIRNQG